MNLSEDARNLIVFLDNKTATIFDNPFCRKLNIPFILCHQPYTLMNICKESISRKQIIACPPPGNEFLAFTFRPAPILTRYITADLVLVVFRAGFMYVLHISNSKEDKYLSQPSIYRDWIGSFSKTHSWGSVYVSFFTRVAFLLLSKLRIRTRAALSPSGWTLATITVFNAIQWYDISAENPSELPFGTDPSWAFLRFAPVSLAFLDDQTLVIGDNSRQFFVLGRPGEQVVRNGSLILPTAGFHSASG